MRIHFSKTINQAIHSSFFFQWLFLLVFTKQCSIVAGFAIFSVLGYMTYERGVDISEVAELGKYWVS